LRGTIIDQLPLPTSTIVHDKHLGGLSSVEVAGPPSAAKAQLDYLQLHIWHLLLNRRRMHEGYGNRSVCECVCLLLCYLLL
jgi:hypothetical protein